MEGEFKISKSIAGRRLEIDEVSQLLKEKRIGPLDDFISKAGKRFSAMLKLDIFEFQKILAQYSYFLYLGNVFLDSLDL